ncbi:MAG: 13E12 repeat family protein [Streptosporangiales bacterium]|nr:13E12 repeat family protein [Streptosporangiales bacterium]
MAQSNVSLKGPALREPRLAGFAAGGCYDAALPSAAVTGILEAVADGSGRPPGEATDDELIGMMGCWQSAEAHAHARMLAMMRELIRRRANEGFGEYPGALPGSWDAGAAHEVAAELGISWQAAAPLLSLAWELEARLPGVGRLLDQGILTGFKAKIAVDEFMVLDDEKAAGAERLLLERDLASPEMTPGKLRKLCQRIADTVDPDGAKKRREDAQRERARVEFFRAHGGDTRLFAEGLPADDALMAKTSIQARATAYREAGIYPDEKMDLLRVLAMLDLINEVPVDVRVARYEGKHAGPVTEPGPEGQDGDPPGEEPPAGGRGPSKGGLPSLVHLTLPLATLMGMAERPGEAPGYGSVDPGLVRELAAAAARSSRTQWCFTVTDPEGRATGHACAKLLRGAATGGPGTWDLVPDPGRPGPEGGYGTWILTIPGGARFRLQIHPVPLGECDHRYATDAYRPGRLLRHLVEVRDGECSFTGCSHPASQSDFEHGRPYDQGGATDSCNASPMSRRCHRVKQSRGWSVSQPAPDRHVWHTPSGRTYEKGAMRYPG